MLTNQHFVRQILLYVITPVILALIFITLCFFSFQKKQTQVYEEQLFELIESAVVTPLGNHASPPTNTINAILKIDGIHYISLYSVDTKSAQNFGLPLRIKDYSWLTEDLAHYKQKDTSYKAFKLSPTTWLIAGTSNHNLLISEYKNFFLVILTCIVVLGCIAFFSTKLHNTITGPLQLLVNQTRLLLTQNTEEPIRLPEPNAYQELADIINEIINFQHSIRDEMKNLGDQSTKELRETLETVEIQNIELDLARKNALQASKAKSEFLANTSHELRTPLNGILGFTSLLLKTNLSNQQRDYLSTIEQSSHGLLTVINDILDFSKLETGQLTLEYKPILLHELIEDIFSIYAPQAHEKNLRLLSMVHPSVQQNLLGDPHRITQVITNLITNAIKFSTRGNIIIRASSLSETDNQTEIKITITDNGIGLTEEQQEQLFTAFSKIDSSDSRLQGGAGLGLAIAKGLIHRMRGEIGVESTPNRGSSFWFTLCLGIDNTRPSQSSMHNSLYGINALVYDANTESRNEITHHLSEWGVFYLEESSLIEIEKPLSQTRNKSGFDIVILDAYTDINSFDRDKLLRIIHNINARYQIPVIILAPTSIQRLLQEDILGLNTVVVIRPIMQAQLHQSICNQLDIIQPLSSPEDASAQTASGKLIKNTHVLVVEDNPANMKLVCEFLKGLGVQVTASENGYDALNVCEKSEFDLIFMDVQMPGMDGLETTQQLRERESHSRTPIIALTAHAVDEQKTRLLLSGMDDYLSKPVSESDLKLMIDRWTSSDMGAPRTQTSENTELPDEDYLVVTSEEPRTPQVFDWSESMTLAKQMPDLARDMLSMLLESIESTRKSIQDAYNKEDWETLSELAHKFHGGCCYCGVPRLRKASKEVEDALYANNKDEYQSRIAQLFSEMDALTQWMEEYDLETLFSE